MKPETADRMNELARMTPEEREAELVREVFGPVFDAWFQPATDYPDTLPADMPVPTMGEEG